MLRSSSAAVNPTRLIRIVLGVLLVLDLVGAGLVLYPPGGSAEDLENQLASLQSQLVQKRALVTKTREHTAAVEKGRSDGDQFLGQYFLARRTAYTSLLTELEGAAHASGIKPRETAYAIEPIDGSDTLTMMVITANFEGSYHDLMMFVHAIDTSPRLLIIDSLTAAPVQGSNQLAVSLKMDTFVREEPDVPGDRSVGSAQAANAEQSPTGATGNVASLASPEARR